MPGFSWASSITSSASPTRSRASSVENASLTIGAMSRCAEGKRGCVGCARHAARPTIRASATALFDILNLDGFAGNALGKSRGHEAVEVAVEHVVRRGRGDAGAQVFDELVGLKHVGADLVPPADVRSEEHTSELQSQFHLVCRLLL